jgi:hypothetical protein
MPKQANVKEGARAARRGTPIAGTPTPTTVGTGAGGIVAGDPVEVEGPIGPMSSLGEVETASGLVDAFTIDDERMLIKLNCGAVFRLLVFVRSTEPHFANAVGLTMMAYNNRDRLSVRYVKSNRPQLGPDTVGGLEFGLGEDAFEVEDWPFTYQG